MKSYTITVNGNVYDVTVEENTNGAPAAAPAPRAAAPAPAPAAKPAAAAGAAGSISITAGAAGKVVDVVAAPGAAVKKGDPVVVLEIMKMETPVVAPQDGTVASVDVTKGETVESGAVLATMNA
ncbi:biotin attachment protein [Eubacterium ramulus]|uniref:Biotin attachment protein n=1 Tax=Eubacterium ramulus TaxID=39490 RepID=A0A2V1JSC4_EUBRA|nr:biotin/lipoyl-containing protein [Eubacterium ramulus]PWE87870.1 biotin attachment protein [Eubacterium ramulus]